MCESSAILESPPRIAIAPAIDMMPHTHSGAITDRSSIGAPTAAPANIASTDAVRYAELADSGSPEPHGKGCQPDDCKKRRGVPMKALMARHDRPGPVPEV